MTIYIENNQESSQATVVDDITFAANAALDLSAVQQGLGGPQGDPESFLADLEQPEFLAHGIHAYFQGAVRATPNAVNVVGNWAANANASPIVVSNTDGHGSPEFSVLSHHSGTDLTSSLDTVIATANIVKSHSLTNQEYEIVACNPAHLKRGFIEAAEKAASNPQWKNTFFPDISTSELRDMAGRVANSGHPGLVDINTNPVFPDHWSHKPDRGSK